MKIIKQSTYESCLSCCLLMLTQNDSKHEIEVWKHGWKFNYLIGQLNYVANKFKTKIEAYVENKYYFGQLNLEKNKNVNLINKKVGIKLLKNLLDFGEVIVYLDCFYLQKILHAPHFVVATKKSGNGIEIIDPADGKIKIISTKIISKAMISLRNRLKYSPILVRLSK